MTSVFHDGEVFLQTQSGIEKRADKMGNAFIRDHIVDQHKEFFEGLSYLFIALQDNEGRPWLSLMQGAPGFINSPEPKTLNLSGKAIAAQELQLQTSVQNPVGLVGLDLGARRRNRLNGNIKQSKQDDFLSIAVGHSFGNCPKYIQLRKFEPSQIAETRSTVEHFSEFSDNDINLIANADTLFIASANKKGGDLDANHRGGRPGFVRVGNKTQLWFNDYPGNNFFQTFGNVHNYSTVGLMFLDFETGDLLLASGNAKLEKIENAPNHKMNGRFLPRRFHFTLERGVRIKGAVSGCWSAVEMSPFLYDDLD